jgi:hypothetical protein
MPKQKERSKFNKNKKLFLLLRQSNLLLNDSHLTRIPEKSENRVAATYAPELEKEVRQWITDVTAEKLEGTLGEALRSGGKIF